MSEQPDDEHLIDDIETLKVYFDPLRMRLMQAMTRPRSVAELAQEVGVPFTRLYYHMHLLEKHGLIRLVSARSIGGAVEEKYYQITAREFVVNRRLLTPGAPGAADALHTLTSTTFDAARDDFTRQASTGVVDLAAYAPAPRALLLRRDVARLTPERARAFYEKLLTLVREFQDASGDAGALYSYFLLLHPTTLDDTPDGDAGGG